MDFVILISDFFFLNFCCFCFRSVSSSCARGFGVVVLSRPIDGGDDSGGDSKLLLSLSPPLLV